MDNFAFQELLVKYMQMHDYRDSFVLKINPTKNCNAH